MIQRVAAVLVLAFLIVGADPPTTVPASASDILAWDHSGMDEAGGPETMASFELGVWDAAGVAQLNTVTLPSCGPGGASMTCEAALTLLGLTSGTYQLRVRAVDDAGNKSDWCTPLKVSVDLVPPSTPSGCRLIR